MEFQFNPNTPPICDICKVNPAQIQFVEQRGTHQKKVAMCQSCGAEKGIMQQGGNLSLNIPDIMAQLPNVMAAMTGTSLPHAALQCPNCGLMATDFSKTGRVGCSDCYEVFGELLKPVISKVQPGTTHRGLVPERSAEFQLKNNIDQLKLKLKEVVAQENYEEAASLRDQIRAIETSESGGSESTQGNT
ncbi:MAG: UvrB/UvrC motif-containing protein [Candidatus Lindowbacteria bacterium]|nr:UvrB/UvrC motif-containing protein [Candidatus Lindowbacteria bacterium]